MDNVCRNCFCHAYCFGLTYVEVLISKLKAGDLNSSEALEDSRSALKCAFVENLPGMFDIELTPRQLAALVLPNTVASLSCFAWMQSFFDAVGDKQPNHNEIHLEPTEVKAVYAEY